MIDKNTNSLKEENTISQKIYPVREQLLYKQKKIESLSLTISENKKFFQQMQNMIDSLEDTVASNETKEKEDAKKILSLEQ